MMGLFTSNCPKCDAQHHWFLKAPADTVCSCGHHITAEEYEVSYDVNYFGHVRRWGLSLAQAERYSEAKEKWAKMQANARCILRVDHRN